MGRGLLVVSSVLLPSDLRYESGADRLEGTCATYTQSLTGDQATYTTSKGPCAVVSGALSCATGNTATVFTVVSL